MKLYDKNAVGRHLDLTAKRIKQLTDKGILTEYRPGLYEISKARMQYINYLRNKNPESEENVDYNTERAKLVKAKREIEELELELRKKELHKADDIERIMTSMLINFKSRLQAIPAEQAQELAEIKDQNKIFKLLNDKIKEALLELSDFKTIFGEVIKEDEESND